MKQKTFKIELRGKLLDRLVESAKKQGYQYSEPTYCKMLLARALRIKWGEVVEK